MLWRQYRRCSAAAAPRLCPQWQPCTRCATSAMQSAPVSYLSYGSAPRLCKSLVTDADSIPEHCHDLGTDKRHTSGHCSAWDGGNLRGPEVSRPKVPHYMHTPDSLPGHPGLGRAFTACVLYDVCLFMCAMHALQVAALLAGHPILIEGFTAFLPDKAAFLQLDDRAGGPAYPLSGFQKWVPPSPV